MLPIIEMFLQNQFGMIELEMQGEYYDKFVLYNLLNSMDIQPAVLHLLALLFLDLWAQNRILEYILQIKKKKKEYHCEHLKI